MVKDFRTFNHRQWPMIKEKYISGQLSLSIGITLPYRTLIDKKFQLSRQKYTSILPHDLIAAEQVLQQRRNVR